MFFFHSLYNTLYLELCCPAVRPILIVISDNGKTTINFNQVAIGILLFICFYDMYFLLNYLHSQVIKKIEWYEPCCFLSVMCEKCIFQDF